MRFKSVRGVESKKFVRRERKIPSPRRQHAEHGEAFPGCQEFFFGRQKTRRPVVPRAGATHTRCVRTQNFFELPEAIMGATIRSNWGPTPGEWAAVPGLPH